MSQTPNSALTSYASVSDLLLRKDARIVGELANDDGSVSNPAALATHPAVAAALNAASGEIESACLIGERYTPADLAALTGVSAEYLKSLVCDIAMHRLAERRGLRFEDTHVAFDRARETLDRLRSGDRIFSFAEAEQAGVASDQFVQGFQLDRLNLASNNSRYFGTRMNRYPRV
jgi:hypothetical protein